MVQVSDAVGPVAGVTVDFSPEGDNPEASATPAHVVTDANGRASTRWRQGQWAGVRYLGAQVGDIVSTAAIAIVGPGPPAKVRAEPDNPHLVTADSARTYLFARVTDQFDNGITGVAVTFVVDSGGGRLTSLGPPDTTVGGAAARAWWLGPLARRNVAHVEAAGLVSPPAVTVGVIGGFTILQGDSQRTRPGKAVPGPIRVQATNADGKLLGPGFPLYFKALSVFGGLDLVDSAITDQTGQATLGMPWVLGPTEGWYRLYAQAEYEGPFTIVSAFALAPRPERIVIRSGGSLRGTAGNFLPARPEVAVLDSSGVPMPDQPIFVETVGPAGEARGFRAQRTDSLGFARIPTWRLSGVPGQNQIKVTTPGLPPAPLLITAVGDSGTDRRFDLTTRFDGVFPLWIAPDLADAGREWEHAVTGDLPDVPVDLAADSDRCHPAVRTTIDDILVFVQVVSMDGPGRATATSRICRYRAGGTIPLIAQIVIDHDDIVALDDRPGGLPIFFRHMLGHALGIGTSWATRPDLADSARARFRGASATSAFNWLRWLPDSDQEPLDWVRLGAEGDWIHWDDTILDVMTGTPTFGSAIGPVSVAALRDLGFTVDDTHRRGESGSPTIGFGRWGDRLWRAPTPPKRRRAPE